MTTPIHTPRMRPRPGGKNRPLEEVNEKVSLELKKPKRNLKVPFKAGWVYPMVILGLAGLLAAGYAFQDQLPIQSVEVEMLPGVDNQFLSEENVMEVLGGEMAESFEGKRMEEVQLDELERRLLANPTIAQAEVYKSMVGVMHVQVGLHRAVGRIINNSGVHMYLDANGNKFPISRHHTAYVPLIRGDFEEAMVDTFSCSSIPETLPVLRHIHEDPFWQAQIAEVIIHQSGELTLLPTIGDTEIEFGFPVNVEDKFANLLDFYRQVAPVVGWNTYRKLSLKYQGQVVGVK